MESSIKKEKKEKIKIQTVGHLNRQGRTPEGFTYDKKPVPKIKLSGLWLEEIGFEIGKKYIVKASPSQVLLLLKECDNNESRSTTNKSVGTRDTRAGEQ